MFSKIAKRAKVSVLFGILCVLFLAGGIYFYHQHTGETVQERVYLVPEQSERQAAPPSMALQRTLVHSPPHTHTEEPYHGEIDLAEYHESDTSESTDASDFFLTEASFSEEPLSTESADDAEQSRIDDIESQLEKIVAAQNKKYPEIAQLAIISPSELEELYPTPEDRQELAELGRKAQAEFMSEFRSLFLQLPADMREDSLAEARRHFTTYMGQGMADAIMKELRSRLKQ